MKKVLFLMFLLLLMGLGAAGVKAQVRIGGNVAPSAAAVLDLNASDAANLATGGLVLPRVDLTSSTKQLTPGVANQIGTLVYNVTTTLGSIGVYYWNGNSWVLASLPSTSTADSGLLLISTGTGFAVSQPWHSLFVNPSSYAAGTPTAVTWTKIYDGVIQLATKPLTTTEVHITGIGPADLCYSKGGDKNIVVASWHNLVWIYPLVVYSTTKSVELLCYRPSA